MRRRRGRRLAAAILSALLLVSIAPTAAGQTEPRSFTVLAAGDIIVHGRLAGFAAQNAAAPGEWDFWPMMEAFEPWVSSADFSICALEVVLSSTNRGLSYYPRFIAPNQVADAIAATGWDACTTATNHGLDGGIQGVVTTLDELDERGIGHSGTARTPEERLPALYEIEGVTVAHLAFTEHWNGLETPADMRWAANTARADQIIEDARWAREQGAEFVILSISWG